jgi:hypothetical protein
MKANTKLARLFTVLLIPLFVADLVVTMLALHQLRHADEDYKSLVERSPEIQSTKAKSDLDAGFAALGHFNPILALCKTAQCEEEIARLKKLDVAYNNAVKAADEDAAKLIETLSLQAPDVQQALIKFKQVGLGIQHYATLKQLKADASEINKAVENFVDAELALDDTIAPLSTKITELQNQLGFRLRILAIFSEDIRKSDLAKSRQEIQDKLTDLPAPAILTNQALGLLSKVSTMINAQVEIGLERLGLTRDQTKLTRDQRRQSCIKAAPDFLEQILPARK